MNLRVLALLLLLAGGGLHSCRTDPPAAAAGGHGPGVELKRTENVAAIVLRAEPDGLNPLVTTLGISRQVARQIFQTLTDKDPRTFEQLPLLAGLPDISPRPGGGAAYAYELSADAKWPNGLPVTAQDVVFSIKAMMNPLVEAGAYRPYYRVLSNVVTNPGNERRFTVETSEPYLLAEEAIGSLWIYPEYVYDPDRRLRNVRLADLLDEDRARRLAETSQDLRAFAEAFNDPAAARDPARIVGSGPYRLTEWRDGQRLRLERRDDYWKKDEAIGPEALSFEIITDNNTIGNALRDELVDVVVSLELDQFREFREDDYLKARYDFATVPSLKFFGILLNQRDPLLTDARVRRALAHLVDVDLIIEQLFPGMADRVTGPILPSRPYYRADLEAIPYDPERARALLAEAGWTDTNGDGTVDREIDGQRRELRFELLSFARPLSEAVSLVAAEGAARAGVDITVVQREPRALYGELNKGNFVASIYGLGYNPGPEDLTQNWASTSVPPNGTNRGGFADPEADRIIRQISRSTDPEQRTPLYERFQDIVYENQPLIFLFSPQDRVVVSKRFDYELTSIAPNVIYQNLRQRDWNRPGPAGD